MAPRKSVAKKDVLFTIVLKEDCTEEDCSLPLVLDMVVKGMKGSMHEIEWEKEGKTTKAHVTLSAVPQDKYEGFLQEIRSTYQCMTVKDILEKEPKSSVVAIEDL